MSCVLKPEYALIDGVLRPDVVVSVDRSGMITDVEFGADTRTMRPIDPFATDTHRVIPKVQRLRGKVLLPGFVNTHSHAFQRLLRGRTEFRAAGHDQDDFWSWRRAMYRAANAVSPDDLETVSAFAFVEMLRAGFTHVGEFHYLHHQPGGARYDDPIELTTRVLAAAQRAGIGISLLRVAYQRAGFGKSFVREQLRFVDTDLDEYARALEATEAYARPDDRCPARVGVAAHSVRALDREWLTGLAELAGERPIHAHVSEQPLEVEECLFEHGMRPVELLSDVGLLSERFTAIHATHVDAQEVSLLGGARANACICPTTEQNLGDGLPNLAALVAAGVPLSIGTDSHAHIDPFAELRGLEHGERLRTRSRNVLARGDGHRNGVAGALIEAGTRGGARALGLLAGEIATGQRADLITLDLNDPAVAAVSEGENGLHALLAAIALGGGAHLVKDVWVGGQHVVSDGIHVRWETAVRDYAEAAAQI